MLINWTGKYSISHRGQLHRPNDSSEISQNDLDLAK